MKEQKITVIGQGYVGLPLSLSFAMNGCRVIGVDTDPRIYRQLSAGETSQTEEYRGKPIRAILQEQLASGNYQIVHDGAEAVRASNVIVLTVGIPTHQEMPDYTYFESACRTIAENLQPESLVLIRSTVVPGTTEEICKPLFEEISGLKVGKDLFLAYVPERIAEGKAFEEFETMPTLIGALDPRSARMAEDVIKINSKAEIIISGSMIAVETAKVLENLQRDANIAIVQEFARFAEKANIDTMEVIRLANTHKRVNLLSPGPGVGGYCIPNAFHYLNAKAKQLRLELPLLGLARAQNDALPHYFAHVADELLRGQGKVINECKIAVAGLAMKDYSPDDRLSPAVDICDALQTMGATLAVYDPNVPTLREDKVQRFDKAVESADALLLLNRIAPDFAPERDLHHLKKDAVILDLRAMLKESDIPTGMVYWRI